jgi:hypothetical protein
MNVPVYRRLGFLAISVKKIHADSHSRRFAGKNLRDCLLLIAPFVTLCVSSGPLVTCAGILYTARR